jgi:trehalose-6-phosphate synthase
MSRHRRVDTRKRVSVITTSRGETRVGAFPISIDFREYARQASSGTVARVAASLRDALSARQIILGLDRLDYTKGIPERLKAFRTALERHEELRGRVSLIQVVVPSREDIPEYRGLKLAIETLISQINGQFTEPGWVPIHYMYRSLERSELLALYKAADVALITPLKDGMNLIAKEYCAANTTEDGALILSEFAGAAWQLHRNALLVNPYDMEGVAAAIHRACKMTREERRLRMRRMRTSVARRDVFWWVNSFLRAHAPESAAPADMAEPAGKSFD